ncbi:MAG: hypothetical protein JWM21_4327 [Acidobacteria bacterium]|nr:hypothetical protein [Acidobacteriota bacterium]
MTGLAKGLIISVAVVAVIAATGIGVGIYWVSTHGGEFLERSKQTMIDGAKFGKGTDNQGCVTETISRYKQDPGFSSALSTQLFLQGCLRTSRETPRFCDNVPGRTEFIKSAQWQAEQCAHHQLRDSYCPQIFAKVQMFCDMRRTTQ